MKRRADFMENNEKLMLTAEDVAKILQVKESCAYRIIRQMNTELAAMGKLVIRGRVNRPKKGMIPLFISKKSGRMLPPSDPIDSKLPPRRILYFYFNIFQGLLSARGEKNVA